MYDFDTDSWTTYTTSNTGLPNNTINAIAPSDHDSFNLRQYFTTPQGRAQR
jgi:hypothetical protein